MRRLLADVLLLVLLYDPGGEGGGEESKRPEPGLPNPQRDGLWSLGVKVL